MKARGHAVRSSRHRGRSDRRGVPSPSASELTATRSDDGDVRAPARRGFRLVVLAPRGAGPRGGRSRRRRGRSPGHRRHRRLSRVRRLRRRRDRRPSRPRARRAVDVGLHRAARVRARAGRPHDPGRGDGAAAGGVGRGLVDQHRPRRGASGPTCPTIRSRCSCTTCPTTSRASRSSTCAPQSGDAVRATRGRSTAWPDVPTRFLLCRDDRFFPADFQRRVVRERLGFEPDEMDGGHLPALGPPARVGATAAAIPRRGRSTSQ